jgi:hypothetical protein
MQSEAELRVDLFDIDARGQSQLPELPQEDVEQDLQWSSEAARLPRNCHHRAGMFLNNATSTLI